MVRLIMPIVNADGAKNGNMEEYIYKYTGSNTFEVDSYIINGMNHEHSYIHTYKLDTDTKLLDFLFSVYCRCRYLLESIKYVQPSDFCFEVVNGTEEEKDFYNYIKDNLKG